MTDSGTPLGVAFLVAGTCSTVLGLGMLFLNRRITAHTAHALAGFVLLALLLNARRTTPAAA